jgi:ABC-type multidrug transport system ATPase subunit
MRESTMQSILNNPKYGPRSELGTNMFTYLKFGLPRVLPPDREETSSDFNSSEEEVVERSSRARPRLRAARSEDFLDRVGEAPGHRSTAGRRRYGSSERLPRVTRSNLRSVSEANLLSSEHYSDHQDIQKIRRDFEQHGREKGAGRRGYDNPTLSDNERTHSRLRKSRESVLQPRGQPQQGLRSRAASQLSITSRHSKHAGQAGISYRHDTPMLNDKYFPKDTYGHLGDFIENAEVEGFKYPHLQLRNISYSVRKGRKEEMLLDMISVEARGGELVALLSSKGTEGTALFSILANQHSHLGSNLRGDIIVNGINVQPARLADRVAYVEQDVSFSPDMSVRQTLLFHSFMREPGTLMRSRDNKGRIDALIEDLGLSQVKHTRVADLTLSEKQRLNVACHLLLDTDIVLLDQPTQGMDIFDTFFLVEYLRQWAARGRIVILTMQPPTYEIFTMVSKVILLSCGRLMYFGKRREMLPYFALIEYPCPAYKNPADYYMDLVTLDDLSPEAMLESSQRVEHLCAVFHSRRDPLSDPGPPGIMPPKIRRANFLKQIFGLWMRAMIFKYPFNVINWVKLVLVSGIMSVCIGGVYAGMRWRYWDRAWLRDPNFGQETVSDRLGFHHVMMCVGVWPMLLNMVTEVWRSKPSLTRDVDDRLYSKLVYGLTKAMYSMPGVAGEMVAYVVPAYLLAGIHYPDSQHLHIFYTYIGLMLLYLLCVCMLATSLAYSLSSRHLSAGILGCVVVCQALVSGYLIHADDLPVWVSWLRYVSPQFWMSHPILSPELGDIRTLHCHSNPMITDQDTGIIKQVACGLSNGMEALSSFSLSSPALPLPAFLLSLPHYSLVTTAVLALLLSLLCLLALLLTRQLQRRKYRTTQK